MATSLLRLGRLGSPKCLLREIWGTQKTPFVAALCTKADALPKTAKKAKAATKEVDERASLLAYKPAVAFPSKLSATGFLPKDIALGESDSTAKVVITETVVATADTTEQQRPTSQSVTEAKEHFTKETEVAEAISTGNVEITEGHPADKVSAASNGSKASDVKAEVQQDQEDTSSSSSSDSESDSDSDDEKQKTETVVKSEEKAAEEVLTSKQVHVAENNVESESVIAPSASFEESKKYAQAKVKPEGVPTTSTEAVGSGETLIDPVPVISSSMMEAIPEVTSESIDVSPDEMVDSVAEVKTAPTENIVENESETKAKVTEEEEQQRASVKTYPTVIPEVTVVCSPQEVANTTVESKVAAEASGEDVSESVPDVVAKPEREAASEMVAKDVNATEIETASSENLKDPAPVAADAVAAQSLAETEAAEAPEEQALEKSPEPDPEPFDNTTYKNLQHHHYNMYTFVDMDVEMAKHRLSQPSSGRPSPRH
ncbi:uncharacterized protein ndufv3 isoform X2 [Triplophysa rosa]|uniref:uncharacterized protein ndufv3 isoform X2 n=1 Tax=Triplophysa rosa TaxID=992332 RepID=UPI00254616BF|nr:uncharacterized protein ndufv3 isoform X2 [Triplophysa rosa]